MNKYVLFLLLGLLAAGLNTMYAEESRSASNPFSETVIKVKDSVKTASSAAKVVAKKDKKDKKSDDKFPVDGVVQGDCLRLRQWPWGPVMGMFYTGDKLTVTGVSGEFYEVTINGLKGYMHKNYVSIPGANASMVAPYYPGNTASGGYLSRKEGKKYSDNAASDKSDGGSSSSSGAAESGALASYTGGKLPPDKFISLFGPVARDSMKATGVPASVTLAQAILETGWGECSIGDAKNLFGIKGTGPAGTTVVYTQECYNGTFVTIKDGFRKYHSWQQSIDDHAALLQNSRYGGALATFKSNGDANQYARGIHQAGYATDPGYANKLISLMKDYNLYQWDVK